MRRALLSSLCIVACTTSAPAPAPSPPAEPASTGATDDAPREHAPLRHSEAEICAHLLEMAREDLGHADEVDAALEEAAVQECTTSLKAGRDRFGIVFPALAECIYNARNLEQVGACEDRFIHAMAEASTGTGLAFEAPIVVAEVCSHEVHLYEADAGHELSPEERATEFDACAESRAKLRARVGNEAFDRGAKCLMDATTVERWNECDQELETMEPPSVLSAAGVAASPVAAPVALEALEKLRVEICACTDEKCRSAGLDAVGAWAAEYAHVEGTVEQEAALDETADALFACAEQEG